LKRSKTRQQSIEAKEGYKMNIGNDTVDLRDLTKEEIKTWKEAIEKDTGYDFDDVLENEPVMIEDSYFETYAQELAEDCGLLANTNEWPNNCIDWEQAARELKCDYTSFNIGDFEYYFRAW
jgi:hypothetical protein